MYLQNLYNFSGLKFVEFCKKLKGYEVKSRIIYIRIICKGKILLNEFIELTSELDNENELSLGSFNQILEIISEILYRSINEINNKFITSILYELKKLLDLKIMVKKEELQKKVINLLFSSGMYAVEIGNEDVIKMVSDNLGWIAKDYIELGRGGLVNYTLAKAVDLYNICIEMEISDRVIIFIGTLFIILGGYSHSLKHQTYLPYIVSSVKNLKDINYLNKSKLLRTINSARWDAIINGGAKNNINNFYKLVNSTTQKEKKVHPTRKATVNK